MGLKVATVNGGFKLLDREPDAYGLFEVAAHGVYPHVPEQFPDADIYINSVRSSKVSTPHTKISNDYLLKFVPAVRKRFRNVMSVGRTGQSSPPGRGKRYWPSHFFPKPTEFYRGGSPLMGLGAGSATLMLAVVCEHYKPEEVYVIRCTGYRPGHVWDDSIGDKGIDSRTAYNSNRFSSAHIYYVTHHFKDTKIYWVDEPLHPHSDHWNVTFLNEERFK